MEVMLLYCNANSCNLINECVVRYKVTYCLKSKEYLIYKLNSHVTERGITPLDKKLIQSLIFENDVSIPKQIEKK